MTINVKTLLKSGKRIKGTIVKYSDEIFCKDTAILQFKNKDNKLYKEISANSSDLEQGISDRVVSSIVDKDYKEFMGEPTEPNMVKSLKVGKLEVSLDYKQYGDVKVDNKQFKFVKKGSTYKTFIPKEVNQPIDNVIKLEFDDYNLFLLGML